MPFRIPYSPRHLPFCGALLAASLFVSATLISSAEAQETPVRLIVKYKPSMARAALSARLSEHAAAESGAISALQIRTVSVAPKSAAALLSSLKAMPEVEYAEPDATAHAFATANDPYFTQGSEWYLAKIQAPTAWDLTKGSTSVIIAVVDSGVRASHPDLTGKVLPGYDFVANDSDANDENGHGTAVAGVAAPACNNGLGVAGVAWANPILPVRVLDASGSGSYSAICNGIIYAADRGARIINLSLGGPASSQALQDAVNYAWNKKCLIVAAAGNEGSGAPSYPAACKNVIAVSATNSADARTAWSNYGSHIDLAAPGEGLLSLSGANGYAAWSGTSFSSPVTAGVLALMASINPNLSNTQLADLLVKNADDLGTAGFDNYYGNGRVNALRAVSAAKNAGVGSTDKILPIATIAAPVANSILSGTTNVAVSATDNIGVTRLELYVDAALVAQANGASTNFPLNTLNYTNAAHTLQVRAYDAAGNVGTASFLVTVKNTPSVDSTKPIALVTQPANGSRLTSPAQLITISGTDNVKVTRMELYLDGKLVGSTNFTPVSFNWITAFIAPGTHTVQARAYDAAGNVGISPLISVLK